MIFIRGSSVPKYEGYLAGVGDLDCAASSQFLSDSASISITFSMLMCSLPAYVHLDEQPLPVQESSTQRR